MTMRFAELAAATNYSFLHGASHPSDMVAEALALGHTGIGIADRNTVAGVVRAHVALRDAVAAAGTAIDFRLVVGARLVFADATPDIIVHPVDRAGWGRLTRLLTLGNLRAEKGGCTLFFADLKAVVAGMALIVMGSDSNSHRGVLESLHRRNPGHTWLGATMHRGGRDRRRLAALQALSAATGVPLIAVNAPLYATPGDRPLQDVMTCIREKTTIHAAGRRLAANAERHLKPAAEMARLFAGAPEAITATQDLLAQIRFSLDDLTYEYPHEPVPPGWTPMGWLIRLTMRAARDRYHRQRLPAKVRAMLADEFMLIAQQNYAFYFLTVHDLVAFARAQDPPILCQGRGSAANSVVCFLLGITSVDPVAHNLLFSRFVSADRNEPPDIDVDFEHERREEVMQYIYRRYGRHRAGIAATVAHYRPRSAVREVGKVLGLSEDITTRMSSTVWGSFAATMDERRIRETGFDLANPDIARLTTLVGRLLGFPRHLGQHVGGFVLTQDRLDETVPIHNAAMADRTFIEWDKDDIDALKLMKVDVLALGMLTCIRKAFDLMRDHGLGNHTLEVDLMADDPVVYNMLCKGDSIGVFQVESRAQINMLPRLKPRKLYDLTVQVAIVRPGPIQGDMVHPYLRRRAGIDPVEYPSPKPPHPHDELETLLGATFGVPLFQEQAMKLAIVAAGFTPSQANQLRRSMATFRHVGGMDRFREKLVGGMTARGYQRDFAERCYAQIEGFGSYGFPESHALSFARLVYVSSWIKCHQPAVFACALLNSQPMGFYAPAQIVRDAREHGITVLPVDVNASHWDNSLSGPALQLGLRQVDGFREIWAESIVAARPFDSVEALARRARLPARALRLLADADAFRSIALDRRQALWDVRRTPADTLPLFAAADARELAAEADVALPEMTLGEHVAADYQTLRLSLKAHPMALLRPVFAGEGVLSCAQTAAARDGRRVKTAGVVLVRQRPGNGNAIFITIEDESGVTNIVIWARLFEIYRRAIMASRLMVVEGTIQRSPENVVHLMATRIIDRSEELSRLSDTQATRTAPAHADEDLHPGYPQTHGHPRNVRVLPRSRDFH
ncbi:error-prone DNA polymerase [Polymorphobacter fuscus]|uniref:Error-prone DNA polymerase n=1 Tax=Sandarakinorhabdus fusca TaxID=1439888 RepID=A0A7C9GWG0_9SPHN|nr:error-prone DNA polymerase [Polymorphobacter fuscus]KAB7645532.1 DNA polymerase III subunit alpha [Polymorphobacter fuscus]MQT17969.1 DNA polymerase III subunit alpha [Polymorphobacter fuscus]NJC08599.1 error-prone DNA polymerase [Polymorphobacter fuscus]